MLQNVLHAANAISHDLIEVGTLLVDYRVSVPTAIFLITLSQLPKDVQVPLLATGFILSGIATVLLPSMKYRLISGGISTWIGVKSIHLLNSEINRMTLEGCTPPGAFSPLFEKYLFCKYGR